MAVKIPLKDQIGAVKEQRDVLFFSYRSPITNKVEDGEALRLIAALDAAIKSLRMTPSVQARQANKQGKAA